MILTLQKLLQKSRQITDPRDAHALALDLVESMLRNYGVVAGAVYCHGGEKAERVTESLALITRDNILLTRRLKILQKTTVFGDSINSFFYANPGKFKGRAPAVLSLSFLVSPNSPLRFFDSSGNVS